MMRELLKAAAAMAATALVLPMFTSYLLSSLVLGSQHAFPGWSQGMSLLPGLCGVYLRRAFYRMVLARCENGSVISFGAIFSHRTAQVGLNVYIGPFGSLGDVILEDDVLVGSHVSITNGSRQHGIKRLDIPVREQPGSWPRITIGCDTWIGDRAVVMADVGAHCVVGAGAVVTRPVPDYAIVIGSPAKIIAWRTEKGLVPADEMDVEQLNSRLKTSVKECAASPE